MGHKINAVLYRQGHKTIWQSIYNHPQDQRGYIYQDEIIRKMVEGYFGKMGYVTGQIVIMRGPREVKIYVPICRRRGKKVIRGVDKLVEVINRITGEEVKIVVGMTTKLPINAEVVGKWMEKSYKKRKNVIGWITRVLGKSKRASMLGELRIMEIMRGLLIMRRIGKIGKRIMNRRHYIVKGLNILRKLKEEMNEDNWIKTGVKYMMRNVELGQIRTNSKGRGMKITISGRIRGDKAVRKTVTMGRIQRNTIDLPIREAKNSVTTKVGKVTFRTLVN